MSEETKNTYSKEYMHPYVHCSITEATKVPTNRRVDKKAVARTYCTMEYYSAIKMNEILLFVTAWMDLKGVMLSKMSQSEKGKIPKEAF